MTLRECWTLALLFLINSGGAVAQAPAATELRVRESRIALEATLDYQTGALRGRATYDVLNISDGTETEVPFNLNRLMRVTSVHSADGIPVLFTQDVVTFTDSPKRQVTHVRVPLSAPLPPDSVTRLSIEFEGFLVGYTEVGSLYIRDRIDQTFSILRADAYAFPVIGYNTAAVNRRAPYIDFDFETTITVPTGLTVASGGALVEQTERDGFATFVHRSDAPAPFLNIPIARYGTLEDAGVRVYYFPEDSAGATRLMERTMQALQVLEGWFGPMGRDARLSIMEIPDGWGSQASLTGGIIQTASAFRDLREMPQLYHELTHLWNAPDTDLPSARWNEGLASYLSRRMALELDEWTGMDAYAARTVERAIGRIDAIPGADTVPFRKYGDARLTDLSYSTGFVMFYVLDHVLGKDVFDRAVGGHFQAHRVGGGTFEDLIDRFRDVGGAEMTRFFRDWVYTTTWLRALREGASLDEVVALYRSAQ